MWSVRLYDVVPVKCQSLYHLNKGKKAMKFFKQFIAIFAEKALNMSAYRNLAIALIAAVLWTSTTATSFAYANTNTLETFKDISQQFTVENIAFKQLPIFQENSQLIADATSWNDETKIYQGFQEAWTQPNKKESLFNVCNSSEVDRLTCLISLKYEIKAKKQKLIDSCYKTPGTNGKLCLDLALKQLDLTLSDFDNWINELELLNI